MPFTSSSLLGIDKDDECEEEDEKGVSLLEVEVPHGLCNIRKAVTGKETAQLWRKYKHSGQSGLVIISVRQKREHSKPETHPVDGVGVWGDLFGVQEGAKFRLVILQQQSVQVKRSSICHTVPETNTRDTCWIQGNALQTE